MIVTIKRLVGDSWKVEEYKANAVKYSGGMLAIDIVGIGWRTVLEDISNSIIDIEK